MTATDHRDYRREEIICCLTSCGQGSRDREREGSGGSKGGVLGGEEAVGVDDIVRTHTVAAGC